MDMFAEFQGSITSDLTKNACLCSLRHVLFQDALVNDTLSFESVPCHLENGRSKSEILGVLFCGFNLFIAISTGMKDGTLVEKIK